MVGAAIPINTQIATRCKALGERTGLGVGNENDPGYTLQAGHEHGVCYCISGNTVDRETNQNGTGVRENGSFTVNTVDRHAVAYAIDCRNLKSIKEASDTLQAAIFDARGNGDGKIVPTITGDHENRITDYTAVCCDVRNGKIEEGKSGTLQAKNNGGYSLNYINPVAIKRLRWIVRRLTPTECERLQGYPDGWTDIGEWTDTKGKSTSQPILLGTRRSAIRLRCRSGTGFSRR